MDLPREAARLAPPEVEKVGEALESKAFRIMKSKLLC